MKLFLAGAYGNLGADIFKALLAAGHEVVAADMMERDLGVEGNFTFKKIDVTNPETLKGVCDGADVVITTVGLTKTSATVTNYEIDFQGNLNLLNEAKAAGVKNFTYISVLKADKAPKVPMLHAKYLFEEELKKGNDILYLGFSSGLSTTYNSACIAAEGSTYWKFPAYRRWIEHYLKEFANKMGRSYVIKECNDTNLMGAALAAVSI